MIDKNVFEGKWKEIRGKSKEWWSLINDIDLGRLDKSPDKLKKYVMLLQVKYGYTRKFAGEEINRRMAEHQANERKAPKPQRDPDPYSTRNTQTGEHTK